jgi:hypothetical protein
MVLDAVLAHGSPRIPLGLRLGRFGPRPNRLPLPCPNPDAGDQSGSGLPEEVGRAGSEALER